MAPHAVGPVPPSNMGLLPSICYYTVDDFLFHMHCHIMRAQLKTAVIVVLFCMSASTKAADSWPTGAKLAYIDRCAESMSSQGLPMKQAKAYCTCATNGMEAEFGMKEYDQMMKAEANLNGGEYDRRLYKVLTACKDHLPR